MKVLPATHQKIIQFVETNPNEGVRAITTLTTNYTISKQGTDIILSVTTPGKYYIELLI